MSFLKKLDNWRTSFAGSTALVYDGIKKTYEDLYQDVLANAVYMRQEVSKERIAVLGATSYQWLALAYGALVAGKTVIAVDPLLPVADVVSLLNYTDAELVYSDEEDRKLRAGVEEAGMEMVVFDEIQPGTADEVEEQCLIEAQDGDFIFFTSGTSSKAKGVVTPFDAVYENAFRLAKSVGLGLDGTVYTPMPFYHIYANTMTLGFLSKGQTVCIGTPRRIQQELQDYQPQICVIVSTMAEFLLDSKLVPEATKLFTVAGAKCEKSLEIKAAEVGIDVQNLYGASETAGGIALSRQKRGIEYMMPAEGVQVLLEAEGEIAIQTLGYMKEYYKNPQATAETMRDGKIYLGDVGQAYEDGTFSPLGRKQDVIAMKNGNKLYCEELDGELSQIEGVAEACVLYTDGKIVAVAVMDGSLEQEQVRKNIKAYNKQQPYFRKIEELWIRTEPLPRTKIGKLIRRFVLEAYLEKENKKA